MRRIDEARNDMVYVAGRRTVDDVVFGEPGRKKTRCSRR